MHLFLPDLGFLAKLVGMNRLARRLIPGTARFGLRVWRKRRQGLLEPELRLVPFLADPARITIDVGANVGLYAHAARKHSLEVWAFEPVPRLQSVLRNNLGSRVRVLAYALSDRDGKAMLRIPLFNNRAIYTRASLERLDEGDATQEIAIECRRLDSFDLGPVGFIKIDVEGHELAVLRGGLQTVKTHRPALGRERTPPQPPLSKGRVRLPVFPFVSRRLLLAGHPH